MLSRIQRGFTLPEPKTVGFLKLFTNVCYYQREVFNRKSASRAKYQYPIGNSIGAVSDRGSPTEGIGIKQHGKPTIMSLTALYS